MKRSIRDLVKKKVINCFNGAFSDKWLGVVKLCRVGSRENLCNKDAAQ